MVTRVLIVDDQAPFREAARMVVEATEGFEVVAEVETGEDAVQKAVELEPDLVLMDLNLPGIDGLEATSMIRDNSQQVVVLMVSTYEAGEYAVKAGEAGASAYIPKSEFSPERLAVAWRAATHA